MSFLNKLKERSAAFSASRAEETHEQDGAAAHTLEGGSSAVPRDEPQSGILKAEAAKVAAGWWIYVAWVGIALVSYVYGLDNNTTYAYLQAAATHFGAFPLYSSMSVLQQVLIGVIKLPVAKLSDVIGRAEAYTISVLFYIIGFIVIATSQSVSNVFGGVVLQAIGNTGTQIMQQIVIADWVPADWRGFAIGLVSWPYIVNFAVAPRIVGALCPFATCSMSNGWRWGAGMFTIMLPVVSAPIIMVLALSQRRAQKQNLIKTTPITRKGLSTLFFKDFDIPGLVLIVAGWLLVLLPLQLHAYAPNNWQTPYIIAMFVVGGVCLIGTGIWEGFFSPRPIIRRTYIVNKNVLFPTIIGFFDFLSFYCSWLNAYMWVSITFDWTATQATYFSNTQSICLTVFGITAGFIALITKRYKWQMVIGACIRLLGLGLMIRYRTPDSTTGQIIMPQVLQGLGGGMLGVLLQVTAQVNVPHQDVAMVTAFVLLLTEIGGAVGSAITGAVQLHVLPNKLALYLPQLSATERAAIVAGSYSTYAYGTPERDGIIAAWSDFMHVSLIIATVTAVVPIILCLGLSDRRLTKKQNAIGDERKFSEDSTDTSVDGMEGSHGSDHKV